MGADNVEEFGAAFAGEAPLRAMLEAFAPGVLAATPEEVAGQMATLLSPPDVAVLTGDVAAFLLDSIKRGVSAGIDGWLDDDLAFVKPWGFDLAAITVPIQLWQGGQDLMVPPAHGAWLAGRLAGVDARLSAQDGHLPLVEHHVGEMHAWLLDQF